jgi:hypothetical protein
MQTMLKLAGVALAVAVMANVGSAADTYGLTAGNPEVKSISQLAFGPDGILFIGDSQGGAVVAIQTGDKTGDAAKAQHNVDGLNVKVAEALGADSQKVQITDIAVNPQTGNLFIAAANGKPELLKLSAGKLSKVDLGNVPFARAALKDAPNPNEKDGRGRAKPAITDLAFVDGFVLVSGLSTAQASSAIRTIAFPFAEVGEGASLEIYHGAHGKVEDTSAVRTFVPFIVGGEPNVLAGFTCTPLVRFPISDLKKGGQKVKGTTVAELGNRNQPLDMIVYKKDGQNYLLMANSARGVMKISTADIEKNAGITAPVGGGGTAGQKYDTIADWKGVVQLDKLNDAMAVVLIQNESGASDLKTVPLP